MSLQSVKDFLAEHAPDVQVIELATSTATVALAAEAHGVEPGQIAKTLSLHVDGGVVLVVTRGDSRLDNKKFKAQFGTKAKMLGAEEVEARTQHPVGGVSPFGVPSDIRIYCDVSMKSYAEVLPAGGAINAVIRVNPERMAALVKAEWIDVVQISP